MENAIKQRIKDVLAYYNVSQYTLAGGDGAFQKRLSNQLNGSTALSYKTISSIIDNFPQVSKQWLLTGEGDMLIPSEDHIQEETNMEAISKMETTTDCEEAEVMESFPILPEVVAESRDTNIEAYIEENSSELERVNPSSLLSASHAAERILRTSMLPTFQPEDIVFVRFLPDRMKLCDGDIYYLNCTNRPTMIRRIKFEPDNRLRLVAQNPQYGDVIISREDIINVGTIVGMLRLTFGDQYAEIEAVRRQKDEQIENRSKQVDNMLDMQRELVAEIREQGKRSARDRERMDALIDKLLAN